MTDRFGLAPGARFLIFRMPRALRREPASYLFLSRNHSFIAQRSRVSTPQVAGQKISAAERVSIRLPSA
jgi:hypothetical protein